jgi:hypothetical protein
LPRFLLSAVCLAASLHAEVLMLDFGPATATVDALTNSPYHTVNGSFSGTVWNQIDKGTLPSTKLVWADGTTATGVQLRVGASVHADVTTLNFTGVAINDSVPTKVTHTGVYAGTSVGQDGLFPGKPSAQALAIGVQLNGLAPGRYEVYVVARNTSINLAQTQKVYVGAVKAGAVKVGSGKGSAGMDFATPGYTNQTLTYASGADATAEWAEGVNYLKFIVTVNAGDALNIASSSEQGGKLRGFINCVQVESLPGGG